MSWQSLKMKQEIVLSHYECESQTLWLFSFFMLGLSVVLILSGGAQCWPRQSWPHVGVRLHAQDASHWHSQAGISVSHTWIQHRYFVSAAWQWIHKQLVCIILQTDWDITFSLLNRPSVHQSWQRKNMNTNSNVQKFKWDYQNIDWVFRSFSSSWMSFLCFAFSSFTFLLFTFYCIVPMGILPWEIQVALP